MNSTISENIMLEIIARSLMVATRSDGGWHPEITEWDRERNSGAPDQFWWWGRRWRHPEQHGE
jgi:hypothetical protein